VKAQITSAALAGNLIGDPATRDYYVYLPPGYDSGDMRYPVVFVLHGYPLDASYWVGRLPRKENQLLDEDQIRPMILVFPDAYNAFGGSWYLSSPTIGDYETYITEELVAEVDANFRTLPSRESRGITGCSVGGYGALHLGLEHPDVFSVAAPMSGVSEVWEPSGFEFPLEPHNFDEFSALPVMTQLLIALTAAAAPNPDNPPFYLDMPFTLVDGEPQTVPEVFERINALLNPANDLSRYLNQPIRLSGFMIVQDTDLGEPDGPEATERALKAPRAFDKTLTEAGVDHEYLEVEGCHCCADWGPILVFLSEHLAQ
jgi:pimeloyl-ACP methyl ester carboxylesterase